VFFNLWLSWAQKKLKTFVNGSRIGNHRWLSVGGGCDMNLKGVMMRSWRQTAVMNHIMLLFWKQSIQSSGFLCPGDALAQTPPRSCVLSCPLSFA
jgi:hypothetical protein